MARLSLVFSLVACCHCTEAPIIGILTVPEGTGCETASMESLPRGSAVSCFGSLYVKYVESAGGRVVPLLYDWSDAQLARRFSQINGVLFTGGGVDLSGKSPEAKQYMHAAGLLFNMSKEQDVPLWGTCMGLQTLAVLADPLALQRNAFDSENLSLPLELSPAASSSQLLGHMPPKLRRWVTSENLTSNLHHDGVPPEAFNGHLGETFVMLASNRDRQNKAFASVMEGRRWPIFGVQFHPERPLFSWAEGEGINHSGHAIEVMQFFANFFMSRARMNSRHFASKEEEEAALIYNYAPTGHSSYQTYSFHSGTAVALI